MSEITLPISDQQRQQFGRVGVLYGGLSAEREVSLQSGQAILQGLLNANVNAVGIDVGEGAIELLQQANIDRAFIALHGRGGEDGQIQALLKFMCIPFTGSDVQASAIALDKLKSKQIWQTLDLPTPHYSSVGENDDLVQTLKQLGGSAFIKPCHEGSSIGMARVTDADHFRRAVGEAKQYDECVLAEQLIVGDEYTIGIVDDIALPVVRMHTANEFYDYQAKYESDDTQYFCPCGLSPEKETELQQLALRAYNSIGCTGWGRVDVIADEKLNFYLLEVNTVPGMTSHSLVPMAAKAYGWSFEQLVVQILATTLGEAK